MKKVLHALLIGVAVVMSLTVASYFVLTKFSPEREMRFMFAAMSELQSAQQNIGISWSQMDAQGEEVRTTLKIFGELQQGAEGIEHNHEFQLVHLSDSGDYQNLTAVLRQVDKEDLLFYQAPGPEIDGMTFDGRTWMTFEEGELDLWGSILPGLDAPISFMTTGWWDQRAMDRLRYLVARTELFHVEWNGLTQIINGKNTRIFNARLDQGAVEVFLTDLVRAKEDREPTEEERIRAAQIAEQLSGLDYRFWIGAADHLLHRVQADGDIFLDEQEIPFEFSAELSNIGDAVILDAPEQTRTFSQVYAAAFGALPEADGMGVTSAVHETVVGEDAGLPVVTFEQTSDTDGDGLDDLLEGFYGTDARNQDTDGDGVSDGQEVRTGSNPLGEGSLFGFGF
ncbi:MAG: thrombospondin type 3 repeat-containing protein [bacterium]|jgi:hypothetical protein|nr:thrombospondin type 3 repeat-containing protein [bacterium]